MVYVLGPTITLPSKTLKSRPCFHAAWDVMELPTRRPPCRAWNAGTCEASTPFPSQTHSPVANRKSSKVAFKHNVTIHASLQSPCFSLAWTRNEHKSAGLDLSKWQKPFEEWPVIQAFLKCDMMLMLCWVLRSEAYDCNWFLPWGDTFVLASLNPLWLAATGHVHLNSSVIAAIVAEGKQLFTHSPQRKVTAN